MYAQISVPQSAVRPPAGLPLRPSEAAGLMGVVLLMAAFVSPEGLRVLLSAAGLLGLGAFRLAAAREGWARRGTWS